MSTQADEDRERHRAADQSEQMAYEQAQFHIAEADQGLDFAMHVLGPDNVLDRVLAHLGPTKALRVIAEHIDKHGAPAVTHEPF